MDIPNRILDAALRVFAETGYRGATTRRIAQVADVNEVTLFRHFGSKEELLHKALRRMGDETPPASLPTVPVNPERELTKWAKTHHAQLTRLGPLIRTCMGESDEHPEMARCAQNRPLRVASELRAYLTTLRETGMADPGLDVQIATSLLLGALFNDALGRSVMPEVYTTPVAQAPSRYVKLFLRAIGATQPQKNGEA
jgi:AcrR family transcriptional regulator